MIIRAMHGVDGGWVDPATIGRVDSRKVDGAVEA